VIVCAASDAADVRAAARAAGEPGAFVLGRVLAGPGTVRYIPLTPSSA
jgi:hypothetical protein